MRLTIRFVSIAVIAGAAIFLAFSSSSALADKRVALVVGNSAYQNVAKLPNPASDASAIAELFRKGSPQSTIRLPADGPELGAIRRVRPSEPAR